MSVDKEVKEPEVECNECNWKGKIEDLADETDDGEIIHVCPDCGSENLYYFKSFFKY